MLVKELEKESKIVTLESTNNINKFINVRVLWDVSFLVYPDESSSADIYEVKYEHSFEAR